MTPIAVRLPPELIQRLTDEARRRGLRLGSYIRATLTNADPLDIHSPRKA